MRILVTGSSGNLGRLIAERLLERLPASQLILLTRTPEKLEAFAKRGATIRRGGFLQADNLSDAFAGAERAVIISTAAGGGDRLAQHRAAFEAAAGAGVRHLFYTSYPNPVEGNPAPPVPVHRESEQALRSVGVAWTILRDALYAHVRVDIADRYLSEGRWMTNMGDGSHAFVRREDCAAAAAGALTSGGHEGKIYDITGPALVDAAQYTALLEEFGGRKVDCVRLDDDSFERYRVGFANDPANAEYVELFTGTGQAIRECYLGQRSTAVKDLSGRAPLSLREMFEQKFAR